MPSGDYNALSDSDFICPIAANDIDHSNVGIGEVRPDSTAAYGQYIASACSGCHRPNLKGAVGPDLTSTGEPGKWTYLQFETALRPMVFKASSLKPEEI